MTQLRDIFFFTLLSLLLTLCGAEPVQYCRYGDPSHPNESADFCIGLTSQRNVSTNAHNLYLTMTHTRRQLSNKGWTAVGVGESMEGSLMFIIYGDPASNSDPIVSIRGSAGHVQPTLLTQAEMGGGDMHVLRSSWVHDPSQHGTVTAIVSLVCYSCTLWPGTALSASTRSQPWIWAWNQGQEFEVYSYDVHLKMHKHHAGKGGWGRFYVDMARAESTVKQLPSVPVIRPKVTALGVSENPDWFSDTGMAGAASWFKHNPTAHLHGMLMAIAFLLLFPAGVVAMRSRSAKSFKYHWIIQAVASLAVLGGAAAGLMLGRIDTFHQKLGLGLAAGLALQAFLGWRHHVVYLRIRRRVWISHAHIWTGRIIMLGGGANLLLGLLLKGYSNFCVGLAGGFMALETVFLVGYVWRSNKISAQQRTEDHRVLMAEHASSTQAYFAVNSSDDEDVDEASVDLDAENGKDGGLLMSTHSRLMSEK